MASGFKSGQLTEAALVDGHYALQHCALCFSPPRFYSTEDVRVFLRPGWLLAIRLLTAGQIKKQVFWAKSILPQNMIAFIQILCTISHFSEVRNTVSVSQNTKAPWDLASATEYGTIKGDYFDLICTVVTLNSPNRLHGLFPLSMKRHLDSWYTFGITNHYIQLLTIWVSKMLTIHKYKCHVQIAHHKLHHKNKEPNASY